MTNLWHDFISSHRSILFCMTLLKRIMLSTDNVTNVTHKSYMYNWIWKHKNKRLTEDLFGYSDNGYPLWDSWTGHFCEIKTNVCVESRRRKRWPYYCRMVERLHTQLNHKRKLKWWYRESVVEPDDTDRVRLRTHSFTHACSLHSRPSRSSHFGVGMSRGHVGNGIEIAYYLFQLD